MLPIKEFLLARIDEDGERAREARPSSGDDTWRSWVCDEYEHVAMGEDRMSAECEAKRRIVEQASIDLGLLRILANVYADHPDYDSAWT